MTTAPGQSKVARLSKQHISIAPTETCGHRPLFFVSPRGGKPQRLHGLDSAPNARAVELIMHSCLIHFVRMFPDIGSNGRGARKSERITLRQTVRECACELFREVLLSPKQWAKVRETFAMFFSLECFGDLLFEFFFVETMHLRSGVRGKLHFPARKPARGTPLHVFANLSGNRAENMKKPIRQKKNIANLFSDR